MHIHFEEKVHREVIAGSPSEPIYGRRFLRGVLSAFVPLASFVGRSKPPDRAMLLRPR